MQENAALRCWQMVLALVIVAILSVSCSDPDPAPPSDNGAGVTTVTPADSLDAAYELPPEARAADGGGQPRPAAYWAVWNSCADDNRSEEAAANGGREAGWFLVDDLLADPGIQLGEHLLTTCQESLALLEGRPLSDEAPDDPAYDLAAQLLAAELNLGVGAETCPAAEETVLGAHLVLTAAGFDGTSVSPLEAEAEGALPRLVDLMTAYNDGDLCR